MQLVSDIIERLSGESVSHAEDVSTNIRHRLTEILNELVSAGSGTTGCMISSSDGIAWAQHLQPGFDQHRFAAMSSALLALSDNLCDETHEGSIKNVVIEGDKGRVLVMHAGANLLLTVFTTHSATLGMSLAHAKRAAEAIASLRL